MESSQLQDSINGNPLDSTSSMQYYLTQSLHWYVRNSLEDMLADYMEIGRGGSQLTPENLTERTNLIRHMFDLPLEFDQTSGQIFIEVILQAIRKNSEFAEGCAALIFEITRKRSSLAEKLKSEVTKMLESVLYQTDLSPRYGDEKAAREELEQEMDIFRRNELMEKLRSLQSSTVRKGRRYAKILIELYHRRFTSATQVLVYLDGLSRKEPSPFFADVLIFILHEIGLDVERRLSKGNSGTGSTPLKGSSSSGYVFSSHSNSTIEEIYKRVDLFMPFAVSSKSVLALQKILQERKQKKSKRSISAEELSSAIDRFVNVSSRKLSFNRIPSAASKPNQTNEEVEASTAL